ncbi:MAG: hypothetical protein ABII75_05285, partial [Candidatus Omnitrophota bacterium]
MNIDRKRRTNIIFKMIALALMQAFLLVNCTFAQGLDIFNHCPPNPIDTLSPQIYINSSVFQEQFLAVSTHRKFWEEIDFDKVLFEEPYGPVAVKKKTNDLLGKLGRAGKIGRLVLDVGASSIPITGVFAFLDSHAVIGIDSAYQVPFKNLEPHIGTPFLLVKSYAHKLDEVLETQAVRDFLKDTSGLGQAPVDAVVFSDILNYVDYRQVIGKALKKLRVGGRMIIVNMAGAGFPDKYSEKGVKTNSELRNFLKEQDLVFEEEYCEYAGRDHVFITETKRRDYIVCRKVIPSGEEEIAAFVDVGPEEFQATIRKSAGYDDSWIYADFFDVLVKDKISALVFENIKRTLQDISGLKSLFAFLGKIKNMFGHYLKFRLYGSGKDAFSLLKGVSTQDCENFIAKMEFNAEAIEIFRKIKDASGQKQINIVIASVWPEQLILGFLARTDIQEKLKQEGIKVRAALSNPAYFEKGEIKIKQHAANTITPNNKIKYFPQGNIYIGRRGMRFFKSLPGAVFAK